MDWNMIQGIGRYHFDELVHIEEAGPLAEQIRAIEAGLADDPLSSIVELIAERIDYFG